MPEMKPRTKAPKEEQLNEPLEGELAVYDEVGLILRRVQRGEVECQVYYQR